MAILIPKGFSHQYRNTRMLKCHSVQHFDYILNQGLKVFHKKTMFNLYYTLAKYKEGIPDQTLNLKERDNSEWQEKYHTAMTEYDFLIDIDAGNHDEIAAARSSAINIIREFDDLNIPYELRFSGCGFHIIIPYRYFAGYNLDFAPLQDKSIYKVYSQIAKKLADKHTEMIDLGIYDSRRLCKIPYSLAIYPTNIYICAPVEGIGELNNFSIRDYQYDDPYKLYMRTTQPFITKPNMVFNPEGNVNPLMELIKGL